MTLRSCVEAEQGFTLSELQRQTLCVPNLIFDLPFSCSSGSTYVTENERDASFNMHQDANHKDSRKAVSTALCTALQNGKRRGSVAIWGSETKRSVCKSVPGKCRRRFRVDASSWFKIVA